MNTGPRIRAALPDAVNQPMYTPCAGGEVEDKHKYLSLIILKNAAITKLKNHSTFNNKNVYNKANSE
jgi:hypothetical protein